MTLRSLSRGQPPRMSPTAGGGVTPVIPPADIPESFADVDAYLRRRKADFEFDLDNEVAQSIGQEAVKRSAVRVGLLEDLIHWLAPAVAAEEADRQRATADDSVEAAWHDAGIYGAAATALMDRLRDGNR